MLPDFRRNVAFWEAPRHSPFVLLVEATSVRSVGLNDTDSGKPKHSDFKACRSIYTNNDPVPASQEIRCTSFRSTLNQLINFVFRETVAVCCENDMEEQARCVSKKQTFLLFILPVRTITIGF
jgi:hypothetical protein